MIDAVGKLSQPKIDCIFFPATSDEKIELKKDFKEIIDKKYI